MRSLTNTHIGRGALAATCACTLVFVGIAGAVAIPAMAETPTEGVAITKANFPDSKFRTCVKKQCDTNHDGVLSNTELAKVKKFEISSHKIKSMQGVGYFYNLTYLDCSSNKLTELDVTKNKKLTTLRFGDNKVSSIDMAMNKKLGFLACDDNKLTKLDVTKNRKLKNLTCGGNSLTKLNVTKNKNLKELICDRNKLTKLNVTKNKNLKNFHCGYNKIKKLDLSKNKKLIFVTCQKNKFKSLCIGNRSCSVYCSKGVNVRGGRTVTKG